MSETIQTGLIGGGFATLAIFLGWLFTGRTTNRKTNADTNNVVVEYTDRLLKISDERVAKAEEQIRKLETNQVRLETLLESQQREINVLRGDKVSDRSRIAALEVENKEIKLHVAALESQVTAMGGTPIPRPFK